MASLKELLNLGNSELSEGCKTKKKTKKNIEANDLTVEALTTILEMVESDALTSDEIKILASTVEYTFSNILESAEEDYEEEELEDDLLYTCNDCGWEGYESDLDEDGNCPECGGFTSEAPYEDEDEMFESNMLNKTPADVKRAAKSYAKSAKGKKTVKNANRKRAKFAAKIDSCAEKGKTFSFKEMTCVKPKKRR